MAMIPRRYGDGPYFVEMALQIQGNKEQSHLIIEMQSEFAHAVHGFFEMMGRRAYNGISVTSEAPFRLVAGSNGSGVNDRAANLGYPGGKLVSFLQYSPCVRNSFGYLGAGPELKFLFMGEDERDGNRGCFGTIRQGEDELHAMQAALEAGRLVVILETKFIGNMMNNDEL